jgi:hypothetical protein
MFKSWEEARGYVLGALGVNFVIDCEYPFYHGTLRKHYDSISTIGLMPSVGEFVETAYGGETDEELRELVFLSDRNHVRAAITAMFHHVGTASKKSIHDVTMLDIATKGMMVCVEPPTDAYVRRPRGDSIEVRWDEDDRVLVVGRFSDYSPPTQTEPGDLYSESSQTATSCILGHSLVVFVNHHAPVLFKKESQATIDAYRALVQRKFAAVSRSPALRAWVLETGETWSGLTGQTPRRGTTKQQQRLFH